MGLSSFHTTPPTSRSDKDASEDEDTARDRGPGRGRTPVTVRAGAVFGVLFVAILLATGPLRDAVADQSFSTYFPAGALGGLAMLGGSFAAETARARSLRRHGTPPAAVSLGAF